MPYYTGVVTTPANLKTLIETHAIANGWTLSAQDYLYKGKSYIKLHSADTNFLKITGANSADGTTSPAGFNRAICIKTAWWPVTYYISIHTNPDIVICTLVYDTDRIQVILFGDIVKVNESAYTGGNFFWATGGDQSLAVQTNSEIKIEDDYLGTLNDNAFQNVTSYFYNNYYGNIPFITIITYNDALYSNVGFHAEIDGNIWDNNTNLLGYNRVTWTDTTKSSLYRGPSSWNGQTNLVPMELQMAMGSNLYAYLGYIEHMRFVRVDNYQIGDIITIATDKWKVFPWKRKNVTYRNGGGAGVVTAHSGTVGFAVKYDGP